MKDSDKELLKQSTLNTIDALVGTMPALNIARGLAKALLFNGLVLRQNRAMEFIEKVISNPSVFTKEIIQTEEFQDGFVYTLEQYIKERSDKKRLIAQKIFLGFATNEDKSSFDLEKYLNTLSLLSVNGLVVLIDLPNIENQLEQDKKEYVKNYSEEFMELASLGILNREIFNYKTTKFGEFFLNFITR